MKKIVILSKTDEGFEYEKQEFEKYDVNLRIAYGTSEDEVIANISDADVILFSDVAINGRIIDNLTACKLIVRYGIGYDNVDTVKAAEKGIAVCNAPEYGVVDVAEHALSLIMSCCKRLTYMDDCVRGGMWDVNKMGHSHRITGKTIGFVGFGKIAKCLCERTNALGMKAMVYDPFVNADTVKSYNAASTDFDTLLKSADYVTLHLPLNDNTKHMLGKCEFEKMKQSAVIINTSRGGLINEAELIDALENGEIAGAGLDVFENESALIDNRLLNMKNVVLTPHIAWNTVEGIDALHREVTDNVTRFLRGEKPVNVVNGVK